MHSKAFEAQEVSRLIHFATGDMYTHVSIGLDGPQGAFYSFGRKYRYLALPGGLVMESAVARLGTTPCCLCKLSISDAMYLQLRQQICSMYTQRKEYHYNLLGLFACFFNLSVSRSRHYFCSQFVATILEGCGAIRLPKPAGLFHPADFCQIGELQIVYQGPANGIFVLKNTEAAAC